MNGVPEFWTAKRKINVIPAFGIKDALLQGKETIWKTSFKSSLDCEMANLKGAIKGVQLRDLRKQVNP